MMRQTLTPEAIEPRQAEANRRVRPRAAASLVIVRRRRGGPEVLMGCRGARARFMAGRYVFPGGGVHASDHRPWTGEESHGVAGDLLAFARAAIRETYEETGLLVGQCSGRAAAGSSLQLDPGSLEAAYADGRVVPILGQLQLVGRAITPTNSRIRYHARFFRVDADCCIGEPSSGDELDNVRFYAVDALPQPISDVTRFMLDRALVNSEGAASAGVPLYCYLGSAPRIRWK
jgi:8-oxo-dGTP pyrophosphatase MutT (NUDIX family)